MHTQTVIYPQPKDEVLADLWQRLQELDTERDNIAIQINQRSNFLRQQRLAPLFEQEWQRRAKMDAGEDATSLWLAEQQAILAKERKERKQSEKELRKRAWLDGR